jgi:hypothetical protein
MASDILHGIRAHPAAAPVKIPAIVHGGPPSFAAHHFPFLPEARWA